MKNNKTLLSHKIKVLQREINIADQDFNNISGTIEKYDSDNIKKIELVDDCIYKIARLEGELKEARIGIKQKTTVRLPYIHTMISDVETCS